MKKKQPLEKVLDSPMGMNRNKIGHGVEADFILVSLNYISSLRYLMYVLYQLQIDKGVFHFNLLLFLNG